MTSEAENHGNMLTPDPWPPNQHAPLHLTPRDNRSNTRLRTRDSRHGTMPWHEISWNLLFHSFYFINEGWLGTIFDINFLGKCGTGLKEAFCWQMVARCWNHQSCCITPICYTFGTVMEFQHSGLPLTTVNSCYSVAIPPTPLSVVLVLPVVVLVLLLTCTYYHPC